MIDERQEELAALYALDLLEGGERVQFETALARDPALQALVRDFRESSTALAHLPPSGPAPAALKARLLASLPGPSSAALVERDNVIRPSAFGLSALVPWAIAACFAFAAAWFGQLYVSTRTEASLLRAQQEIADIALKTARNQLEAERLLGTRHVVDLNQQIAENMRRLTDTQRLAAETEQRQLATQREADDVRRQLNDAQNRLASAEDALAATRNQIVALTHDLKSQADLAELKITALASMLNNSPQALAVAVWHPAQQEGVLKVEKLPALAANEDYQLWVVDPQYPNPVDGGVFTVDPLTGEARLRFKTKQPVRAIAAFAVTRERKGGVTKSEKQPVLLGK